MAMDFRLAVRLLFEFFDGADVIPQGNVSFCPYRSENLKRDKIIRVTGDRPGFINRAKAPRPDMFEQLIAPKPICVRLSQ